MYRGDATNAVIKTVSPEAADNMTRYASEMDEILIMDRWFRIKIIYLRRLAVLPLMQAPALRFSRVTVELQRWFTDWANGFASLDLNQVPVILPRVSKRIADGRWARRTRKRRNGSVRQRKVLFIGSDERSFTGL